MWCEYNDIIWCPCRKVKFPQLQKETSHKINLKYLLCVNASMSPSIHFLVEVVLLYNMPHVSICFNRAPMRGFESSQIQCKTLDSKLFTSSTDCSSNQKPGDKQPATQKQTRFVGESNSIVAKKVCNAILIEVKHRIDFADHLSAVNSCKPRNSKTYRKTFFRNIWTLLWTRIPCWTT